MKERFPSLIALFLLLGLVVGTWWAAEYTQRAVTSDPPRRFTHEMDSWSRNFVMLRSSPDGKPINRLEGDYAEHYPDDDSYVITAPRAIGQQAGSPITVATSKTGVMYDGGKRIVMQQDAHMHRKPDADTPPLDVRSEKLVIMPDDNTISTDLPAVVLRGQSQMNGTGMTYNNKTRQLEVYSASNVNIAPADTQRAQPAGQSAKPSSSKAPAPAARPPAKHTDNAKQKKQP
jgi:lipopolysaccharide export system protein LptC